MFRVQNESLLSDLDSIQEYTKTIEFDASSLERVLLNASGNFLYDKLHEIEEEMSSLEIKVEQAKNAHNSLSKNLDYLIRWHRLAEEALDIFQLGIKAKDMGSQTQHQEIASIEEEIDMYLKQHRKGGLPHVELFERKYSDIKEGINEYIFSARRKFLTIRDNLIKEISPFRNPEYLPKALFSEADPKASYQGLKESLQEELYHLITSLKTDIRKLYEDISYLFNISKEHLNFKWNTVETLSTALNKLENLEKNVAAIEISSDNSTNDDVLSEFLSEYATLKDQYSDVLKAFRETRSFKPELNELESDILSHIASEGTSLKGLFIHLHAKNRQITTEKLFNVLRDLFEKTQIAITIKRYTK